MIGLDLIVLLFSLIEESFYKQVFSLNYKGGLSGRKAKSTTVLT
jgi:hypothetical protein